MIQPAEVRKGTPVVVAGLGPASVVRPTLTGALVELSENGLVLDLPLSKIRSVVGGNGAAQKTPISDLTHIRLRALEALRFGLVPKHMIDEFTLGYASLETWVRNHLPGARHGKPVVCEVRGPFGTGKSHTVAVVRHIAEKQGYLHARVEVDGQTVSFCNPGKLLHTLWATLMGKGFEPEYPVLELYLRALQAAPQAATSAVEYLMTARDNLETVRQLRLHNAVDHHAQLIEGLLTGSEEHTGPMARDVIVRSTPIARRLVNLVPAMSRTVVDRPGCLVESMVGTALLSVVAGYKGLVVTVDEFEAEYGDYQRLRQVRDVLAAFQEYFQDENYLPSAPLSIFFATVGSGTSGDDIVGGLVKFSEGGHHLLKPWSDRQVMELSQKLHKLYCDAYELSHPYSSVMAEQALKILKGDAAITSGLIRGYIKLYIGLLDIAHGPPGGAKK